MNPNVITVHTVALPHLGHPATPTPSTFLNDFLSEYLKDASSPGFTARLSADADPFVNGWNAAVQYMNGCPAPVSAPPALPMPLLPINVIFNNPATVVYWNDGTKTVVKCQPGDTFSAETGLTTAMLKKCMGNDNTFNKIINYWLKRTGHYNFALSAPEIPALSEDAPPSDGDNEVAE